MKFFLTVFFIFLMISSVMANEVTKELQRILDLGDDLVLERGEIYDIDATLILRIEGQQVYTRNAVSIRDYATLRVIDPEMVTILNAEGIARITIKNVRFDGNRQHMKPTRGIIPSQPFISMGKNGGDDQTIKNCIITNARCSGGWAAIHVHEHALRTNIQNNIIFGAGVDVLGNGRSDFEKPFAWGDGISVAARNSLVKNNLIIDATDEGIMVQGASGTKVLDNVIVALSREVLGGIALIAPADYCLLDSIENTYDYRGVEVKNNLVDALGSRVHIGFPCGLDVWNLNRENKILVGAEVIKNKMTGKVGGYGFAVSGVKDFKIIKNEVDANFEEIGDGLPNNPPDDASAFIFDASKTIDSKLQPEFKQCNKHIIHIMRNFRKPKNDKGYRILNSYGTIEVRAIINAAYIEMLNRIPNEKEVEKWTESLNISKNNADEIRSNLMLTEEFIKKNKEVLTNQLQECRTQLFNQKLLEVFDSLKSPTWPSSHELHKELFSRYN